MAELYRFRSIDSLLVKHRELEEQTIYFASPEELNDPMEGLRDIVWDGDKIVWTNFFKHYIFCLNRSCLLLRIIDSSQKFDMNSIPILERWDRFPIEKSLFDDIWDRFYNLSYIQEIIEALANTKRKIRYSEVVSHLQTIQTCVLYNIILKSYIDHGTISEHPLPLQFQKETDDKNKEGMEMLLNAIRGLEEYENQDALDAMFQITKELHDDIRLTTQYNSRTFPSEILAGINKRNVMDDFPKIYVEQLDRLLWPKWYTACFTGSYHNSSVWAKYADGHKGACLIFETVKEDSSNSLKLNQKTSNSFRTILFHEVHYADKLGEIDFFRTICRTTVSTLMELWYTDENGNTSECAAHIGSERDEAAWKELYWKNFFRDVTFKTKDWRYEQEYRLILDDGLGQFNEKDDRALTYDFNSLKGIIFGMRTSREDKVKIIEIIEKKKECDRNNQTDFKFFEAYYSVKDADIRAREIRLG